MARSTLQDLPHAPTLRRASLVAALAFATVVSACSDTVVPSTAPNPGSTSARPAVGFPSTFASVVINEVMADPSKVADTYGEWFEVYNYGTSSVNLQGWTIASNNDSPVTIGSSVSVPAGGYVVLGRNASTSSNGGVTEAYAYGTAITLANSSDWLALRDGSGKTVDSVAWSSTVPAGSSRGLKQASASHVAMMGSAWVTQTATFGSGDHGTPKAQNNGYVAPGGGGGGTASSLSVMDLDVGQGDAFLVKNGTSTVIIDGGPDTVRYGHLLDSLGLDGTTIDAVILSHQHMDHLAGLLELFRSSRNITVKRFYENKDTYSGVTLQRLRDSINARVNRGQLTYIDTDDPCGTGAKVCVFALAGGGHIDIMAPRPVMPSDTANPNNRSTAEKVVGPDSASFTMWLAGDAERTEIAWLDTTYNKAPGMKVNVAKADHHGSCNGITDGYYNMLQAQYVVVGVGDKNSYGHMHNQTKSELTKLGKPWYRSDQNGTITITTPGTVGGGYSIAVGKGTTDMSGSSDATSSQTVCSTF